jgi:hypothetical protein
VGVVEPLREALVAHAKDIRAPSSTARLPGAATKQGATST